MKYVRVGFWIRIIYCNCLLLNNEMRLLNSTGVLTFDMCNSKAYHALNVDEGVTWNDPYTIWTQTQTTKACREFLLTRRTTLSGQLSRWSHCTKSVLHPQDFLILCLYLMNMEYLMNMNCIVRKENVYIKMSIFLWVGIFRIR